MKYNNHHLIKVCLERRQQSISQTTDIANSIVSSIYLIQSSSDDDDEDEEDDDADEYHYDEEFDGFEDPYVETNFSPSEQR